MFIPENGDEREYIENLRLSMGPQHLEQMIRQCVGLCWTMLPQDKRNIGEVESQLRRVFERAMSNLREDASQFGLGIPPADNP